MINYIICDDNSKIRKDLEEIINKIMMKNNFEYKVYSFDDYNKSFMNIMNKPLLNKIYILDIETPSESGINIARKIREKDIESIIIFLTMHYELGSVLLEDEIMFLTFISKFNNMEERTISSINKAIQMLGQKQAVRFEDHGVLYTIPINDILYITHDSVSRKSVIVTDYTEFNIAKTLTEMISMVDDRFIRTHKSCLANKDRIMIMDKKNNKITFDNGTSVNLLSNNYKETKIYE